MVKKIILGIFVIYLLLSGIEASSQDYIYSQFYANPIYLNPALAGLEYCGNITLNYRNQWPSLPGNFVSYSASFDQYSEFLHGGIGVQANYDKSGEAAITTAGVNLMYAYHLTMSRDVAARLALQAGMGQRSIDWNKLIFEDQIDPNTGNILPPSAPPDNFSGNKTYLDLSGGFVIGLSEKYFFGCAVHHLTQPDIGFYSESENILKMKITAHAGANISFDEGYRRSSRPVFTISPNILYQQQGDFKNLNIGSYFLFSPFVVGFWFRNNFKNSDAVILLLGFHHDRLRVGYSYDYTVSKLTNASGGAHELSFTWIFECEKKSKRPKAIKCPTF